MYGRVSFRPCRIPRGRISAIWWPPRYPAPAQASGESWKFYAVYTASGSSCWPSLPVTARSSCPRVNAQPLTGIAAIGWPPPTRILRSTSNTCGSFVRRAKSKTVTGICRSATGFDVTSAYHFQNRPRRLRTSARQTENRERKSAFNGQKRPKPLSGVRKAVWKSLYFPAFERDVGMLWQSAQKEKHHDWPISIIVFVPFYMEQFFVWQYASIHVGFCSDSLPEISHPPQPA